MRRFGKILHTVFHPGTPAVIAGIPVTALLMLYVFALGHEGEPLAYVAYLLSAYCLIVLILWLIDSLKPRILHLLHKNQWIHRYLADVPFKTMVSLYRQAALNLAYVVIKFVTGIYYRSPWFIMLSVYYLMLTLIRFLLLRRSGTATIGQELRLEYRKYRECGIILIFLNFILTMFVLLVIRRNHSYTYAGMLIYVMAAYTFYLFIMAVRNLFKYRKHSSPLISASKVINFAAALISMLALETAMLSEFGGVDDESFRPTMVAATGGVISVIFILIAIYMVIHSTKELRRLAVAGGGNDVSDSRR